MTRELNKHLQILNQNSIIIRLVYRKKIAQKMQAQLTLGKGSNQKGMSVIYKISKTECLSTKLVEGVSLNYGSTE